MYDRFEKKDDVVLARFITYMKKAISNTRINYLKHQIYLRNNEDNLNDEEWLLLSDKDNHGHFSFSYKNIFELFENEKVAIAFKNLTDLQKKVIYLNVVEKNTLSEIGKMLKVSEKSVEKTKSRALKNLKKYMEEKNNDSKN